MIKFLYVSSFLLAIHAIPRLLGAPTEPELFLTKYIKDGQLDKARELSSDHMKQFYLKSSTSDKLQSFSGYLTVDEAVNSNIFFWFFPALENPTTAPVVMWMSENTGFSCLKGVFLGPFYLDDNLELKGFSFTDKEGGYDSSKEDESAEVYEALSQFFTLFSEYCMPKMIFIWLENLQQVSISRDFKALLECVIFGYFAPEHASGIVSVIHDNNEKGPKVTINLEGMMFGSPLLNMPLQLQLANHIYSMGLINEQQRDMITIEQEKIGTLIKDKKFKEAHDVIMKVVLFPNNMYERLTGLENSVNILITKPPKEIARFINFLDTN
ncbi:unnamed protein product [Allacma fusca]|uniref:Uncharacterized protein n=1 Tax=Allacma fusca TaxID=39272 RepID=A0A8J2L3X8_9HEXA|nr:unnamed protein product [Allacma fusca]